MNKSLVKRSKFQKIIVSDTDPINILVEGDEVFVSQLYKEGEPIPPNVEIIRQIEREREKLVKPVLDENAPGGLESYRPALDPGDVRMSLAGRGQAIKGLGGADLDEGGVNLLCGFSDMVTFCIALGQTGVAEVLIETITYERRK